MRAGLIVTENCFVAVPPPVTWAVKLEVPAAVGVPLSTPVADRLSPQEASPQTRTNCKGSSPRWPQASGCMPSPPFPPGERPS